MKKLLCLLLTVLLILTLAPMSVLALATDTSVSAAAAGGSVSTPAALAAALGGDASWVSGNTVTMRDNVEIDAPLLITGGTMTLNFGGFTLEYAGTGPVVAVSGGSITFDSTPAGGGMLSTNADGDALEIAGGSVVINGGSFAAPFWAVFVSTGANATLTINGGTFLSTDDWDGNCLCVFSGTATINGGTFNSDSGGIYAQNMGTRLIINNAEVTASLPVSVGQYASVTVNGGTFTSTDSSAMGIQPNGLLELNGGQLIGDYLGVAVFGTDDEAGVFNMYGGSITATTFDSRLTGKGVSVSDGVFNMYGGSVSATGDMSAGVHIYDGKAYLCGGTVRGETHGAVLKTADSYLMVDGGTLSGDAGIAAFYGNIDIANGSVTGATYGILMIDGNVKFDAPEKNSRAVIDGNSSFFKEYGSGKVSIAQHTQAAVSGGMTYFSFLAFPDYTEGRITVSRRVYAPVDPSVDPDNPATGDTDVGVYLALAVIFACVAAAAAVLMRRGMMRG